MNKYQTNLHYDESRSKQKKAAKEKASDEKPGIVERMEYPARRAELNCGESYKTIWKASMSK